MNKYMGVKGATVEGSEGNEEHVIANWRQGILAREHRKLSRILSCSHAEASTGEWRNSTFGWDFWAKCWRCDVVFLLLIIQCKRKEVSGREEYFLFVWGRIQDLMTWEILHLPRLQKTKIRDSLSGKYMIGKKMDSCIFRGEPFSGSGNSF